MNWLKSLHGLQMDAFGNFVCNSRFLFLTVDIGIQPVFSQNNFEDRWEESTKNKHPVYLCVVWYFGAVCSDNYQLGDWIGHFKQSYKLMK